MRITSVLGIIPLFVAMASSLVWGEKPLTLLDAWPVVLQEPEMFWFNGEKKSATELVAARLEIENPAEFSARALADPVFVLGASVGRLVVHPLLNGQAVVVWPKAAFSPNARVVIFPGDAPERITHENMDKFLKSKMGRGESVAIKINKKHKPEEYPTLDKLRDEWRLNNNALRKNEKSK